MEYLRKYYFIIFILLFLLVIFINFQNYKRTEKIIKSNFEAEIELIKNNVFNSLEDAYAAFSISEIVLNSEMENKSELLLEKYEGDKDPKNWNLLKLKEKMPDYEIYIINRNLEVVNTTAAEDSNPNLSAYTDFSNLLHSRMESEDFAAANINLEQNTASINKYSYQLSPDSSYLFELSIDLTERFPFLDDFNVFSAAENLTEKYEQLRSIDFYKLVQAGNKVVLISSSDSTELELISNSTRSILKKSVSTNNMQSLTYKNENYEITDLYYPILLSNFQIDSKWLDSFVVKVSYDNQKLLSSLTQEKYAFYFNLTIFFIIFMIFSLLISYLIKKTEEMALYDHLTGLPNRKAFEDYFYEEHKSSSNKKLAVLYLDLDNFKEVNDNYGHDTGDLLLKTTASRLKNIIRSQDKVSRMGGDEFTVLLTDIENKKDVKKVIKKIEEKIAEPYQINGIKINISCSIGYSIDHGKKRSFQELINKADLAMYEVKKEKN